MNEIQAFILGVIQGLTEFLPISSSGHLELGSALLGVQSTNNLYFTVLVHLATVLSTIIVFRKDILHLVTGLFSFRWNESARYVSLILISTIPILIIGIFFKDEVEQLFTGNLILVGSMLIITALLLFFAHVAKKRELPVTRGKAFIIGIAQVIAVLPGISRSGATIATGLLLGVKKEEVARFSFLMVLIPILGAAFLDIISKDVSQVYPINTSSLVIGFVAAFLSGLAACSLMIKIIKKGKLIYFAIYCLIIGLIAIFAG